MTLVKPRGITRKGGRKPKGGRKVTYLFSEATLANVDTLTKRWDCGKVEAVERAVADAVKGADEP